MKKINLKSGAMAAVLAGTMALSMVPATAFAAETTTPENYGSSQEIVKTYTYGNTPLAEQTFTFDLSYQSGKSEQVGTNTPVDPTLKAGQYGKASVTTPATDDDHNGSVSAKTSLLDLVNEYSFTAPGSYYFTLSEENSGNPNISNDPHTYTVRVDVVWDSLANKTVKINGIGLFKANSKTKEANAAFNNGSNAATGAFTVSKKVSGTAANTNDYFKYTLELTDPTQVSGSYTVVKDGQNVATLNKNNNYKVSFYLKDGESVSVTGLPKGANYKVTESEKVVTNADGHQSVADDAADNGYTETYKVNNGDSQTGTEATGTVQNADTTVAYTNDKGFATNTGVTMNMLPGIGIAVVAVAGGAALVISRRKRAGQDF